VDSGRLSDQAIFFDQQRRGGQFAGEKVGPGQ
jgi:hypothetical protein